MGPAAGGVYFEAAKRKLDAAKAQATQQTSPATETVGLGPQSKFGLGEITRTDENDPQVMRRFTLHVPIKAKPRVRIDPKDVVVIVDFFDLVNNNPTLERTKADTNHRWRLPRQTGSNETSRSSKSPTRCPNRRRGSRWRIGNIMDTSRPFIIRTRSRISESDPRASRRKLHHHVPSPKKSPHENSPRR